MSPLREDKAREKWCPFTRVMGVREEGEGALAVTTNRSMNMADECNCIASDCMAWRVSIADIGYCGLAGKPEPRS